MTTNWVALLRGINVGGRNRLPMKQLADILERAGAADVRTYIQSGNAVFRHAETDASVLATRIGEGVAGAVGFTPHVIAITVEALDRIARLNPLPVDPPQALHTFVLATEPDAPDLPRLDALALPSESFHWQERAFYLHAPDGIARSKLAAQVKNVLGVEATARNWRTIRKLVELGTGLSA